MTCNNSAIIIDHIIGSYPEGVAQQSIIDVGLSNHSSITWLIYSRKFYLAYIFLPKL